MQVRRVCELGDADAPLHSVTIHTRPLHSSSSSSAEEMAAGLPHGVVETQRTNVEVPLPFGLALVAQLTAALPDPGPGLIEFRGR